MGGNSPPSRAVVQSAGTGYRMTAEFIRSEIIRFRPVVHLQLRYSEALITQMSQTAVCYRHHSLNQQLCRRFLLSLDWLLGSGLVMTRELIANRLGVRREGVTEGALKSQESGLIDMRADALRCWIAWGRKSAFASVFGCQGRIRPTAPAGTRGIARFLRGTKRLELVGPRLCFSVPTPCLPTASP
jgi:hypothetical protein